MWFPGHSDITGNEVDYGVTSDAAGLPFTKNLEISYLDLKKL